MTTDRLDSLGMWDATMAFPDQVASGVHAVDGLSGLPNGAEIENVVVLGMGASGIAGDLVIGAGGQFMAVPVVVTKSYEPPNFTGPSTLCFALSFSGDTEETVESAQLAYEAGANLVVISADGKLPLLADEWDVPSVPVPTSIPATRAALGALLVPMLAVLEDVGLFPGAREWINLAVNQLRRRRDQLANESSSPARALARRIGHTLPIVYGAGGVGTTAALRWKNQIVENAKSPAFSASVPELMHNEICGWGQHGDITRQVMTLVNLRHDHEHPQVSRRFDLVTEWLREVMAGVEEVWAEGEGELAQLLDLMLVGDFVSLHMAAHEGIDPGPIPVLEDIKAALSAG